MGISARFAILSVLILLYACILPAAGYGQWQDEREGSVLEVHESWTEEPGTVPATPAPVTAPVTVPATPPATPPVKPATPPAVPATPPAVPHTPPAVPATPPVKPATPPAVPHTPPAVPLTPPAVPASPPATPLAPNQAAPEAPLPPIPAPDCKLRLQKNDFTFQGNAVEGTAFVDSRKSISAEWANGCTYASVSATWTFTNLPANASEGGADLAVQTTQGFSIAQGVFAEIFKQTANADSPSWEFTITLAVAGTILGTGASSSETFSLKVTLYQPPQTSGADYVTEPTGDVTFREAIPLTFHKSAIKFGSTFTILYSLTDAAGADRFSFGTFSGTWTGTDNQDVSLSAPMSQAQQDALVGGNAVPNLPLFVWLVVTNEHGISADFGPTLVTIGGRAAITDPAEREAEANAILDEKFAEDPLAAVGYLLGGMGEMLSEERQEELMAKAYDALESVFAGLGSGSGSGSGGSGSGAAGDAGKAAVLASLPAEQQLSILSGFTSLLGSDKEAQSSSGSGSGSAPAAPISQEYLDRTNKVTDYLIAMSIAILNPAGTTVDPNSESFQKLKSVLTAGCGTVLKVLTAALKQKPATTGRLRSFTSQAALDTSIRRALATLENVAKASATVDTVSRTTSLCTGTTQTLNNCYFYSEAQVVQSANYGAIAARFDGIHSMGDVPAFVTGKGQGTLIVVYTAVSDSSLFDSAFDPALGLTGARTFGGAARLELYLPLAGSAAIKAGELLPVQLADNETPVQLVIPVLTQATIPAFPIAVRRNYADLFWSKTTGGVTGVDASTVVGGGRRIIDYFWSVSSQPPAPVTPPIAAPIAPTTAPTIAPRPAVQPLAPIAPNTRSTVDEDKDDGNGTAIGVGVGVGVGAFVLIVLILIALWVRSRSKKNDAYVDPEFVVGKNAVWTVDPLMGHQENGHFAPPPTPTPATYIEQMVRAEDGRATDVYTPARV